MPQLHDVQGLVVEGVGFEPTRPLRTHQFSRLALSTAQPPLRKKHQALSIKGREDQRGRETTGRRGAVIAGWSRRQRTGTANVGSRGAYDRGRMSNMRC